VGEGQIRIMTNFGLVAAPPLPPVPVRPEEPAVRAEGIDALERLEGIERPLGFFLPEARLPNIFEAIHRETGWEMVLEGVLPPATRACDARARTAREVLADLATEAGLAYEVPGPRSLVVRGPWIAGMDGTSYPELVGRVDPRWPDDARARGVCGKVLLEGVVRSDGRVGAVRLLRGVDGWPAFAENALAAVRRWRYRPALREGRPVSAFLVAVIEYPATASAERGLGILVG